MTSKASEHVQLADLYGARNYAPFPVVLAKARGVWMWDVDGGKYLDLLSSYSAASVGNCHPRIVKVICDQASKLGAVARAFYTDQSGPYFQELAELCGMEMVLPMNSGAEAVETAIKIARKWGYTVKKISGNAEIVVFNHNFHGRTTTIVGFSSTAQYRDHFGPFAPGFVSVPFDDLEALEKAINKNTVGVLIEPIQGEGGVIIPPDGFLGSVRDLCTERDVLMIADEVQTGLCRTGKMFCCDHESVIPDLYILGKALGGGSGVPVSAVVGFEPVMNVMQPGDHGSTFGGNALACAVARESIKILVEEKLAERAAKVGEYFIAKLRAIKSSYVKEVRGRGLLIGVELTPKAGPAKNFSARLVEEGLICKETHDYVLRFAPPLVITEKEIDWAMPKIEKVLMSK